MEKNTPSALEKINAFTRRDLDPDEVYTFSVILCDNDIDRDGERFSDSALATLRELFVGKTGISDHDPSSLNQTARIFDTQVVTDGSKLTADGRTYKSLRADVYMVKTDENRSLIAEIDAGIKKEVSISCRADKKICSICGADRNKAPCAHIKWSTYGGKVCHTILDGISDAYEWSFVAIPAQVNAGVTKRFVPRPDTPRESLLKEARKLAFISGGKQAALLLKENAPSMTVTELRAVISRLEKRCRLRDVSPQLATDRAQKPAADECYMTERRERRKV